MPALGGAGRWQMPDLRFNIYANNNNKKRNNMPALGGAGLWQMADLRFSIYANNNDEKT